MPESASLGCPVAREHLHVRRREDNANRAWAKSRRQRVVPMDRLVVQAHDEYLLERGHCHAAAGSDFLLVNLFRPPVGDPMRVGAVNELLAAFSHRAGLPEPIRPHMLRHHFATNLTGCGRGARRNLRPAGACQPGQHQVYFHPSPDRLKQ